MLSFTLNKIQSVPLSGEGFNKLIDLSPLANLVQLDLSYNKLKSLKPIEKNIKLEILHLNNNLL